MSTDTVNGDRYCQCENPRPAVYRDHGGHRIVYCRSCRKPTRIWTKIHDQEVRITGSFKKAG